jgi:hypothetical protein
MRGVSALRMGAGAGALTVLALLTGVAPAGATGQPSPSTGIDLSVTVAPGSGAGAPATPGTTNPAATRPTTTTTTVGGSTVVNDSQNPPAPTDEERSIGGVLYLSGLTTDYVPSLDPLSGELQVRFTVRNVSTASIDGTARFWLSSPLNTGISSVDEVDVAGLKPGESRVVDAVLPGTGQWTFATAHYTYTPPATVDGVALEPMTRDAFVFLPPLFLIGLLITGAVVFVVVRLVRATLGSPVATAGTTVPGPAEATA